ncbi:MAG TPA: SDR family NAD(P)-dependent oxidoreductase [Dehalococcoidia bacterium]|nr:SDR family NAD(P)-dependent oxidoreductase [Dehalococcoidia bacterium]
MKLDGKVAIVTGGGRGIGRGIVQCLADEGAAIVIPDIDMAHAEQAAAELQAQGRRALALRMDVRRQAEADAMARRALEEFGAIDILVNNAGVATKRRGLPFTNLLEEDWDWCYEVNVKGVFIVSKAVAPAMKERRSGKIVNIASIAGRQGVESIPHYAVSKAGVISFTQALAKELGRYNINVNAICPGLLWTPMWEQLESVFKGSEDPEVVRRREVFERTIERGTPLGREQTPEDIGKLAAFLCSEDAKNITGQAINVDGGQMLN